MVRWSLSPPPGWIPGGLVSQYATRLKCPIPFLFYRGPSTIRTAAQSGNPHIGFPVVSNGDVYQSAFCFYATPQRIQTFGLNDPRNPIHDPGLRERLRSHR